MESHLRANHVAFWNRLIPTMLAHSEDWMSASSWQKSLDLMTAGLWTLAVVCVVLFGVTAVLGVLQIRHSMLARRKKGARLVVVREGRGASGLMEQRQLK